MRLLQSKEIQNKNKASQSSDLFKTIRAKKILENEVLRLRVYKDSVEPEKRKEVEAFSVFMLEMQKKKALILKEIQELEEWREKLLEPIIEEKLEALETGTSIKKRLINEKIDKLEKIEDEFNARSLKLAQDERELEKHRIDLDKRENALNTKLDEFNKLIKKI